MTVVNCPNCNAKLRAAAMDRRIKCPKCDHIWVPNGEVAENVPVADVINSADRRGPTSENRWRSLGAMVRKHPRISGGLIAAVLGIALAYCLSGHHTTSVKGYGFSSSKGSNTVSVKGYWFSSSKGSNGKSVLWVSPDPPRPQKTFHSLNDAMADIDSGASNASDPWECEFDSLPAQAKFLSDSQPVVIRGEPSKDKKNKLVRCQLVLW